MSDTYEIKSWLSGAVLFAGRFGSLKLCVEAAVAAKTRLDCASLDGAILDGASLDGAILDGARLDRASLVGASLNGANLVGAILDGASLDGAILDRASLNGASLDGAILDRASLVGASLNGASLNGANDIIMLGRPDGWGAYAYRASTTIRVQIGCRNKTLAEARCYWANKPDRREVLAALDYAEAMATIRGWTFETED